MDRSHEFCAASATSALALGSLPCFAVVGRAQDVGPPISTDRPGFLFSPLLVPPGRAQLELGVPTLTHDDEADLRLASALAQFRFGLTKRFELRAAWAPWNDLDVDGAGDESGVGDAEIGAKIALATGDLPAALILGLRLPTGDDAFTTDELGASANLAVGRDLGDGWWLQGLVGINHTPVHGGVDATSGALAALLARSLGQGWSAYVEATAFPGLNDVPGQGYGGLGIVKVIGANAQLDLSADFGLDDDAADFVAALGLSFRF